MIKELLLIRKFYRQINTSGNYLFFPFYHVGGAETVHLNILRTFQEKPNCFITNKSFSDANRPSFQKYSNLIEIEPLNRTGKYRKYLLKSIARRINHDKNPVVFGCNSIFFYDLIPMLKSHVWIADLTHAFSYEQYSPEFYSLPVANRFNARIVLGQKTKEDYANLYKDHGIDSKYTERINIIKNNVYVPDSLVKPKNNILQIVFVARNSPEKRPEIVFEILRRLNQDGIPFQCTIVGDFDQLNLQIDYAKFTGEIHNKATLQNVYLNSDVLLLTSEREGLPMVILEAMAHQVLPISTAIGEISELKRAEPGIILSESLEPEAVISEMLKIIRHLNENKSELRIRQKNCYHTVKENYSTEKFTDSYRKLFHKILPQNQ